MFPKTKILVNLIALDFFIIFANAQPEITALDSQKNIETLRIARNLFFNFLGKNSEDENKLQINLKKGKLQRQFSRYENFFCDTNDDMRSTTVPTSVHELRPGDIDIIGAIGDSLTAGNGAMATNMLEIMTENKGVSFSIGGQGNWRTFLTVPNILKVFNPNLYGYSLSDGISTMKSSKFNAAEIGAMSQDIPHMSKNLVKRMLYDPKVDMQNHWKLVTLMIGPNDLCSNVCFKDNPEEVLKQHELNLLTTLRTFKKYLPRTMVNVIAMPQIDILTKFVGKPLECVSIHYIECPCYFASRYEKMRQRLIKINRLWNKVQEDVANRPEFHNSTDFTVNYLPFAESIKFPKTKDGRTDFRYMSMDCFHLSQRGYAWTSNSLWNNMMEPVGQKSKMLKREFDLFKCPTEDRPFLATRQNSI